MKLKLGFLIVIVWWSLVFGSWQPAKAQEIFCGASVLHQDKAGRVWANEVELDSTYVKVTDLELLPSGELKAIVNGYLMVSDANVVVPGMPSYFRLILDDYQVVAADLVYSSELQLMNWLYVPLDDPTFIMIYGMEHPLYAGQNSVVDFDIVQLSETGEWRLLVLDEMGVLSTFSLAVLTDPNNWYLGFQILQELSLETGVKELTYVDQTGNWIQLRPGHPLYDGQQVHATQITTYWQANETGFAYDPRSPVIYVSQGFQVVRFWPDSQDHDYLQLDMIRLLEAEGLLPVTGCVRPGYFFESQQA